MTDIVINPMENVTGFPESRGGILRAQSRSNGDVEIVKTISGEDSLLGVIPKDKRAELAQFLVTAQ